MTPKRRPRVLSAVQPTAMLHIGNYFGAISNWVRLLRDNECFYAVAVYHALTLPCPPEQLRRNTEEMLLDLVACGVDPGECVLFRQSDVPEHFELMWILSCLAPFAELARMPQFKEKSAALSRNSSDGGTAGLACYPLLQAADILAYNADLVPVGRDQLQHLELTRELARRFNERYGDFLTKPEPLLSETPKIRSLANPTAKMSKSLGARHYVGLFEPEASVRDKVRRAVTDGGIRPEGGEMSPGVANLLEILRACGQAAEADALAADYGREALSYATLKETVADALAGLTATLRAGRAEAEASRAEILLAVRRNGERAREVARTTLNELRERIGIMTDVEVGHAA